MLLYEILCYGAHLKARLLIPICLLSFDKNFWFFQRDYFTRLKRFALEKYELKHNHSGSIQWVFLEFCPLGFIGKLFVASELNDFVSYLSIFYNDWPCDWLLATYTRTRACPLTLNANECIKKTKLYAIPFTPPLFQHKGLQSSLKGKISKQKLKNFPI